MSDWVFDEMTGKPYMMGERVATMKHKRLLDVELSRRHAEVWENQQVRACAKAVRRSVNRGRKHR